MYTRAGEFDSHQHTRAQSGTFYITRPCLDEYSRFHSSGIGLSISYVVMTFVFYACSKVANLAVDPLCHWYFEYVSRAQVVKAILNCSVVTEIFYLNVVSTVVCAYLVRILAHTISAGAGALQYW